MPAQENTGPDRTLLPFSFGRRVPTHGGVIRRIHSIPQGVRIVRFCTQAAKARVQSFRSQSLFRVFSSNQEAMNHQMTDVFTRRSDSSFGECILLTAGKKNETSTRADATEQKRHSHMGRRMPVEAGCAHDSLAPPALAHKADPVPPTEISNRSEFSLSHNHSHPTTPHEDHHTLHRLPPHRPQKSQGPQGRTPPQHPRDLRCRTARVLPHAAGCPGSGSDLEWRDQQRVELGRKLERPSRQQRLACLHGRHWRGRARLEQRPYELGVQRRWHYF